MTKKEILASVGLTDSANDIQKFYEMFPNEADYHNYKNGGLVKKQEGGDVIRSTTDVAKRNDVLFRFLQMNQLDRDKLAKRSDVEIDNMEKYEQSVEGWMKYQDDVAEEKRRQYYEPIDRIKRTWFDEKQYQDGGSTQEQEIQQLLQQIAEQIGQGVEPEAIIQQLVESGVSQEQATMIVQKAIETSQQEQLPIAQNGMEYATQHNYLSNLDYGDFKEAGQDWEKFFDFKNTDNFKQGVNNFGQAMKSTFTPENINTAALATNSLTGYYSPVHALPNTGLLGKIKAGIGLASGLSGALLGWEKVFAKDKSYLTDESKQMVGDKLQAALKTNSTITSLLQTNENKTAAENINSITNPYQNWVNKNRPAYNGPLEAYIEDNEKINNITPPYMNEAPIESYWQTGGELPTAQLGIPSDFSDEIGTPYPSWYIDSYITPNNNNISSRLIFNQNNTASKNNEQVISRGDPLGFVTAMNAVAGLGIFNDVMSQTDIQKQYEEMLRRTGNTDNRFVAQNPNNPFGTYTPNAPMASNFMNVRNGYTQNIGTGTMSAKCGGTKKFKDGGVYTITEEEMKDLLAQGYDIEFLD